MDDAAAELSVVIATFDSAPWLPSTLDALYRSIAASGWRAEIVVVDDGSTDDTTAVLRDYASRLTTPLRVVTQENRGRFLARWAGIQAARADIVLLLDARVLIHEHALRHVRDVRRREPDALAWNAHIDTDPSAPLVGRFWEVPTFLFWRSYLARPRPLAITSETFDALPTGTTMFLAPRSSLVATMTTAWPEGDAVHSSDDTAVLRQLVAMTPTRIDPRFSATYRPRVRFGAFLRHAYHRGIMFIDSYAGTTTLRSIVLIALVVAPPVLVAGFVAALLAQAHPVTALIVVAILVAVLVPAVAALALRCPTRPVLAYLLLILPFGVVFWAGLARGVVVNRRAFTRNSVPTNSGSVP